MAIVTSLIIGVAGLLAGAVVVRARCVRKLSPALPHLESDPPRSVGDLITLLRVERDRHDADVERLAEAVARLQRSLDVIGTGVVVCDRAGVVVLRNAVAAAFVHARHGDALVARTLNDVLEAARSGRSEERSVELIGPPRRAFHVTSRPLAGDEGPLGAVALIDDVSESQRVEAVRRDFVANVSHELKTPVGALSLLAETLRYDEEPEVAARLIGRIKSEAHRVAETIDDLTTLSSLEDRDGSRFAPLDIRSVVASAISRLGEASDLSGVTLKPPSPGAPLMISGERLQLESAVFNLVDNAVKYSEPGGVVEIRLAGGAGLVAVAVQDEGVGIPASERDRIFERFYRVDKARGRDTGGTGLGLSIVRHVVINHGGEIQVASREGEGSTFTILVPELSGETGADEGDREGLSDHGLTTGGGT